MEEDFSELSTFLLIKRYKSEQDKNSSNAIELERLIRKDLNLSTDIDFSSSEIQDKLNKIFRESNRKNEKFINVTAWIFVILTGLSFVGSGCGLIQTDFDERLSKFVNSQLFENINPYMQFMLQHHLLITILSTMFSAFAFFICLGVLYRSNLARKLAIIILAFKIIQNFIEPILVKYVYPTAYDFKYDIPKEITDGMYQSSIIMSVFFSIIFIIIYGWLIYKYTSQEIKEEFLIKV